MMQAFGSRRLVFALAAAALTVVACNKRDNAYDSDTAAGSVALPSDSAAPPGGAMDLPTTEAGVVEFLRTVDNGEVEAGQLAKTKASNSQVKRFAGMMVTEHSNGLKKLDRMKMGDSATAGTTAQTSTIVTTLQSKHQQVMSRLESLSGAEFDRAYIDEMVNGHQQVLDVLHQLQSSPQSAQWSSTDTAGSTATTSTTLSQHVSTRISAVEKHLERARTIQSNLGTGTGGDTTKR